LGFGYHLPAVSGIIDLFLCGALGVNVTSMNEAAETKVCPHCAETIKAAAKVCPNCRFWQKRWSWHNPYVAVILSILALFTVCVPFAILLDQTLGSKTKFATYRDDIMVVSSQLSHRISEGNTMNTVIGTLTNRSEVAWKEVAVETEFFDKSGKQIDAITVRADDYHGPVILPHGEVVFKIEGRAARPEADYENYKVRVRWAKDVDAWP